MTQWRLWRPALLAGIVVALAGCGAPKPAASDPTLSAGRVAVVNGTCPIMGDEIAQARVPAYLVRDHNGKKVGFCCAGCIRRWDALADAGKDARLAEALSE